MSEPTEIIKGLKSSDPETRETALKALEKGYDIHGIEDSLIDICLDGSLSEDSYQRLSLLVGAKVLDENSETPFTCSPRKLAELYQNLMLRNDNVLVRSKALLDFLEKVDDGLDVISPDEVKSHLAGWETSDRPIETAILAYIKSPEEKRLGIVKKILSTDFPWRFSLSAFLKDKVSDFGESGSPEEKDVFKLVKTYLLENNSGVSASHAFKILSSFEEQEADKLLAVFFKKHPYFVLKLLDSSDIRFGDFPSFFAAALDVALEYNDARFACYQFQLNMDTVVVSNLEEKLNRLIETLPPADLQLLLSKITADAKWPGMKKSLEKRMNEPLLNDIISEFFLKRGLMNKPQAALNVRAKFGSLLDEDSFTWEATDALGSSEVELTDEVTEILVEWIRIGDWYQRLFACRILAGSDDNWQLKQRIKEILVVLPGPLDMYTVELASCLQLYDVVPALLEQLSGSPDPRTLAALVKMYGGKSYPYFEESAEEKPYFMETRRALNQLLKTHGAYLPEWTELARLFKLDNAVPLLAEYLKSEMQDRLELDIDDAGKIFSTYIMLKWKNAPGAINDMCNDISSGQSSWFSAFAMAGALMDEDSKFRLLAGFIPAVKGIVEPLFSIEVLSSSPDWDELAAVLELIPTFRENDQVMERMLRYIGFSSPPCLFSALVEKLPPAAAVSHFEDQIEAVLRYEQQHPAIEENEELLSGCDENDPGREILNLFNLIRIASVPECSKFLERLTCLVESVYKTELAVVRSQMEAPELLPDLDEEELRNTCTPGLMWSYIIIARNLSGLQRPSKMDPNPGKEEDVLGLMVFPEIWVGNEALKTNKYVAQFLSKTFDWIYLDTSSPLALVSSFNIPEEESFSMVMKTGKQDDVIGLCAEILEKSNDPDIVRKMKGQKFLFDTRPEVESLKKDTAKMDLALFSKLAMNMQIDYDDGAQFLARVANEKSVEVIAKLMDESGEMGAVFTGKRL